MSTMTVTSTKTMPPPILRRHTTMTTLSHQPRKSVTLQAEDLTPRESTSERKPSGNPIVDGAYWLYNLVISLWLFTESNFPTFVLPNSAFGILAALAGSATTTLTETPSIFSVLLRLPIVMLFNWSNVLIFDLANQRLPESVREDKINKPWRPVPTGRISPDQARRWNMVAIPLVLAYNYSMGVWRETALLFTLTWLYNDLKGGDEVVRDLIIAVAFALYNRGSLKMAVPSGVEVSDEGHIWIAIISGVILTTMQVQDLKDQAGDRTRGRMTVPLWLGDEFSRKSLAILVPIWSFVCSWYWGLHPTGYVIPVGMGCYVAYRAITKRMPKQDGKTWRMWCL